jgi:hypothetical protein
LRPSCIKASETFGQTLLFLLGEIELDSVACDRFGTLDMNLTEYVKFQTLKTLAVAQGLLTAVEGQTVYLCLGESLQTFNDQPIHVKSVLTLLLGELLTAQIQRRSGKKTASRVRRQASAARG